MKQAYQTLTNNLILIQGRQTNEEMARQIGAKSAGTWRARLSAPGTLTVAEITALSKKYGVPIESLLTKNLLKG